jgi:DNA repair exonuclease SbcCD ATPase subunit
MLFDFGNLITLGIVVLVLLLFRLMDRGNRSITGIRKHAEKCKEDLAAFIEDQSRIIKDFGITFDVEQKSAKELLRRIQAITREELAQKVQSLAQIDDRIRDYDSSLEELVQMTGRVQENLNRIKDESAFVENVAKRVGDIKDKVEIYDREIGSIEKKLKTMEMRFEQENAEALERAVEEAVDAARTAMSTLEANAEAIDRRIYDQEEKIIRTEDQFEQMVLQAIDRAGSRASKAEDAAIAKLREQAHERLNLIKTSFEEKIKTVQDMVKAKLGEIQDQLKTNREEWKTETATIEARQKELNAIAKQQKTEWDREIKEFTSLAKQQSQDLGDAIQNQNKEFTAIIKKQREEWENSSRDIGEQMMNAAQERIEEYRLAQEEQFRQLSGIADDTTRLEAELRRSMQEAINRVNGDFALFGKEMQGIWESAAGEFTGRLETLRAELTGVDRELTTIKEKSFENVSEKLKGFEDEFLADLSKRSAGIDTQLSAWQDTLDKRLEEIAENSEIKQQAAESRITEEVKKTIAAQGEKLISDLERLKTETAAFEEGIREEMRGVDESRKSFSEQLERDLAEVKNAAENELNTKIGEYSLSVSDTLRQSQRDLETQIRTFISDSKERFDSIESSSEEFRQKMEEWQAQYNVRMRELDDAMEDARHRSREMITENEERINATKTSLEDIRREISAQAKLFDRTEALKAELTRHVEDMSGNIDRLLQLKNEIAHFENQFIQIKRLEDDVNAKMTRFLSEKRRIEVMETDFNRLLQTSQSVEEKLSQVSNSDDILQTMQVQIRRLEDVIKETEEKYQRVERKNKALQETNDGIDRNFKALQEDEQTIKRLEDTIITLKTGLDAVQKSVETLSAENEKARDAAEKLSTLDETVRWMEKRIAEMNVARESLARLATELQNLDKDAQDQLNLTRSLLNREDGKNQGRAAGKAADDGAPPPRDRENIIRLKRQGWSIDEIARSMKISKGEVELILELGPKD